MAFVTICIKAAKINDNYLISFAGHPLFGVLYGLISTYGYMRHKVVWYFSLGPDQQHLTVNVPFQKCIPEFCVRIIFGNKPFKVG